jgi:hypothetical protein
MKTFILILSVTAACAQQTYRVAATPKTVVIGAYTAGVPPALKARSGDTVEIQTVTPSCRAAQGTYGIQPELSAINE